ncbi:SRPBCC family protein [Streptomyces coeruleorubidus]|uniref:SRPBCC family protein n=1 Tax=Streptomyces coeruleorubidus TaxID=116188 RepID=UPI0033C2BB0F
MEPSPARLAPGHPGERGHRGGNGLTPGAVCLLTGAVGSTYRERLVALDEADRKLTYEILQALLPVRGYRSTLHVQPVADTGGAFLSRHATFDPAEGTNAHQATTVLEAGYAPAIAGLHTITA